MVEHQCDRCHTRLPKSQLTPVPLVLRILAFPMILVLLLKSPSRIARHELTDRYCPNCRRVQVISHVVVGIWSAVLVIAVVYQLTTGQF